LSYIDKLQLAFIGFAFNYSLHKMSFESRFDGGFGVFCKMDNSIDHSTLSILVQAGAIQSAQVLGQSGGWAVMVRYGNRECPLAAQRSQKMRLFRSLETLANYLKGIGIAQFEVNATQFDPVASNRTQRPDRALALRRTHESAAYDAWFREQVQHSLDDPRPSVPDDEAMALFKLRKDALRSLPGNPV
jgi:hypothetical protein